MRLERYKSVMLPRNTLDLSVLEPGDVILVANPHDMFVLRAAMFWSHAALYTGLESARAFVDAVNLPVRGKKNQPGFWQRVRFTSVGTVQHYVDVLVLRPDCPAEVRQKAVQFAIEKVGSPFVQGLFQSFIDRRQDRGYSCSSLIYHAYKAHGVDLSVRFLHAVPWPAAMARHPRLRRIGAGTRVRRPTRPWRLSWFYAGRLWTRYVLRQPIQLWAS